LSKLRVYKIIGKNYFKLKDLFSNIKTIKYKAYINNFMLNKMLKILFIIVLVLLVLFANFKIVSLNLDFYQKEFTKLNVYDKIPDADVHIENLIDYFNDKEELSSFFNEKEKLHLQDVKYLINIAFIIFYMLLILFLILSAYFIYKRNYLLILDSLIISGFIIILLQAVFLLLNFSSGFILFHKILFTNDLWLLNPETDNLINLFPEKFFYDISLKIMLNSLITSLMLIILSFAVKFKVNKSFLKNNN